MSMIMSFNNSQGEAANVEKHPQVEPPSEALQKETTLSQALGDDSIAIEGAEMMKSEDTGDAPTEEARPDDVSVVSDAGARTVQPAAEAPKASVAMPAPATSRKGRLAPIVREAVANYSTVPATKEERGTRKKIKEQTMSVLMQIFHEGHSQVVGMVGHSNLVTDARQSGDAAQQYVLEKLNQDAANLHDDGTPYLRMGAKDEDSLVAGFHGRPGGPVRVPVRLEDGYRWMSYHHSRHLPFESPYDYLWSVSDNNVIQTSINLALLLRYGSEKMHRQGKCNKECLQIKPIDGGWVEIKKIVEHGYSLFWGELCWEEFVIWNAINGMTNDKCKNRFELAAMVREHHERNPAADGRIQVTSIDYIRTRSGHGGLDDIVGDQTYQKITPEHRKLISCLCHKTMRKHLGSILRSGLIPGGTGRGKKTRDHINMMGFLPEDPKNRLQGRAQEAYDTVIILDVDALLSTEAQYAPPLMISSAGVIVCKETIHPLYIKVVYQVVPEGKLILYNKKFHYEWIVGIVDHESYDESRVTSNKPQVDTTDVNDFGTRSIKCRSCPNDNCRQMIEYGWTFCPCCGVSYVFSVNGEAIDTNGGAKATMAMPTKTDPLIAEVAALDPEDVERYARQATNRLFIKKDRSNLSLVLERTAAFLKWRYEWDQKSPADLFRYSYLGNCRALIGRGSVPRWLVGGVNANGVFIGNEHFKKADTDPHFSPGTSDFYHHKKELIKQQEREKILGNELQKLIGARLADYLENHGALQKINFERGEIKSQIWESAVLTQMVTEWMETEYPEGSIEHMARQTTGNDAKSKVTAATNKIVNDFAIGMNNHDDGKDAQMAATAVDILKTRLAAQKRAEDRRRAAYEQNPEITGPYRERPKRARSADRGLVLRERDPSDRKRSKSTTGATKGPERTVVNLRPGWTPRVQPEPASSSRDGGSYSSAQGQATVVRRCDYSDVREKDKELTRRDTTHSWVIDSDMLWYFDNRHAIPYELGFDDNRYHPCKKHRRDLNMMNWTCWYCRRSLWRFVNEIDN